MKLAAQLYICISLFVLPISNTQARAWARTADRDAAQILVPGRSLEAELKGDTANSYRITLAAGQQCRIKVGPVQQSVFLSVESPSAEPLVKMSCYPSTVHGGACADAPVFAAQPGDYAVFVGRDSESSLSIKYTITITDLRPATDADKEAARAEQALAAGWALASKSGKDAYQEAIKQYEAALAAFRGIDDKAGEIRAIFNLARVHEDHQDFKAVLEEVQPALATAQGLGDARSESRLLRIAASAYSHVGQQDKALENCTAGLERARMAGDLELEADALNQLGLINWRQSRSEKALEFYQQALTIRRELGSRSGEAVMLSNIGLAYGSLSKFHEAIDYYNQALPISRAVKDRTQEARILNNLGLAYTRLAEFDKALEYLNQALPIRREVGDRNGEAYTLGNLGLVYRNLSQYEKAIQEYEQSLPLLQAAGDRTGEGVTLSNIGVAYRGLGRYEKAFEYFNRSLPISRSAGNRAQEASTLNNIGLTYSATGDYEKALEAYNQSLPIQHAIGDKFQEAGTLDNIGVIYRRLGQFDKARDFFNQALPLARSIGDRSDEGNVLSEIGVLYVKQGQQEKALEILSQAFATVTAIGDRRAQISTLEWMADAYRASGNLAEARASMEKAISLTESVRSDVRDQDLRQSFFATTRERFDFYISILTELNAQKPDGAVAAAALEASEQERARGLLDLLALSRIDINQGVDPALKSQEQSVQARISSIQSQLVRAASVLKPDQGRISSLNKDLSAADDDRRRVELALRQSNPQYAELRYPTRLDAASIQKLLDPDTLLLEYSLGHNSSSLFAVTRTELRITKLPSAEQIGGEVDQVRSAISSPGRANQANYLRAASALYRDLVAPAASLLAGKKKLLIVPDGPLYYLPFEVLLRGDGAELAGLQLSSLPYLVRDYSISYAPSASVLAVLDRGPREPTDSRIPSKDFLAFADPDYGSAETIRPALRPAVAADNRSSSEPQGQSLDPLPGSRTEVQKIASLFPPDKVTLFLGRDASEENVKAEGRLSQYRYVHFAVHGLINESHPQFSSLALSSPANINGDGSAPGEDGFLEMYEIFNLRLRADLVTLSACQTGLGKQVQGEGIVGLARAFFYAGAPSLVVSLWSVDDRSTASLMEDFYRRLKVDGGAKADALRQAKLGLISEGHFAHPYYWAAFVLNGKTD